MYYKGTRKKNDERSDMVRILSEMEKCTSSINFDGWPFDHWSDHRERDTDTSYHNAKNSPFYLGLSKNKNELTLLIHYHSNNNKTVYISKPLVNFNFHNAPLRTFICKYASKEIFASKGLELLFVFLFCLGRYV